ncbi:lytic transglycosylase domain-containing protein [Kitasatospora sp. LaBMicrA B282]|uniref:lytic transglycosylase domain-containing protein n=1 Tax=Kitasatospora sp. LaBMicrA B282 TaxID=3420949 RepID=UPI003D0B6374
MARRIRKRVLLQTAGAFVALAAASAPAAPLTFAAPTAYGAPASAGAAEAAGQLPVDGGGLRPLPQPPGTPGGPFALPTGMPTGAPGSTPTTGPVSPDVSLFVGGPKLPATVFAAYQKAEASIAVTDPGCHLPWQLLAGIGQVESGQADGGRVDASGTTYTPILGPALDGTSGFAAIVNDGAAYGVTGAWDRAVGPMQFLPSTWAVWGADGNGDGKADPNNIWDAALAAGHYLCADGRDLSVPAQLDRAILGYNDSADYLATVKAWMVHFQSGAAAVPDLPAGPGPVVARPSMPASPFAVPVQVPVVNPVNPVNPVTPVAPVDPAAGPTPSPSPSGTPSAAPSPSASASPSSAPTPSASPTPTAQPTSSPSPSASPTGTPAPTGSPTPSASPTPTPSPTPTTCPTPSAGPSASPTPSASASPTPTPSATPTPTPSPSPTSATPSPTGTPSPSCTTPTPAATTTPSPTGTPHPSPSPAATAK